MSCRGKMPNTDLAINFSLYRLHLQSFETVLSTVCRNCCRLRNIISVRKLNDPPCNMTNIHFRTSVCFICTSDIFRLMFSWVFIIQMKQWASTWKANRNNSYWFQNVYHSFRFFIIYFYQVIRFHRFCATTYIKASVVSNKTLLQNQGIVQ